MEAVGVAIAAGIVILALIALRSIVRRHGPLKVGDGREGPDHRQGPSP